MDFVDASGFEACMKGTDSFWAVVRMWTRMSEGPPSVTKAPRSFFDGQRVGW